MCGISHVFQVNIDISSVWELWEALSVSLFPPEQASEGCSFYTSASISPICIILCEGAPCYHCSDEYFWASVLVFLWTPEPD